ncbi:MAG TPA: S-methyl-5-thioribose-1-phosphate isomerase [Chloroflexota bacterium]|nr:S-methyl-5-thioribose-1-phosphate isomerase [Chloroflexota bacterium]
MQPVRWSGTRLDLLDQTLLPGAHRIVACTTVDEVADAIRSMKVRGAPAIGVTAAYGYALAALQVDTIDALGAKLFEADARLMATRPTAVNLRWALERMRSVFTGSDGSLADVQARLIEEAQAIQRQSYDDDRRLSELGAVLLKGRTRILTHCNAGPLATAGYGTAIGVIRRAFELDPTLSVLSDETRPFLQGARLTAWELMTLGIPVTVITDNMAGFMMQQGEVDAVIVGADRIAANGDVANKIGTYSLAVLAAAHDIPFFVAAPISTVDMATPTGAEIPIEERDPAEVMTFMGHQIAPAGAVARHPAFDVTPAKYITAIITEVGLAQPPNHEAMLALAREAGSRG